MSRWSHLPARDRPSKRAPYCYMTVKPTKPFCMPRICRRFHPGKPTNYGAIGEKPISAGVFRTDDGHKGRFITRNLPHFSSITEFAVSLEPEGGRSQPTGDLYLAG